MLHGSYIPSPGMVGYVGIPCGRIGGQRLWAQGNEGIRKDGNLEDMGNGRKDVLGLPWIANPDITSGDCSKVSSVLHHVGGQCTLLVLVFVLVGDERTCQFSFFFFLLSFLDWKNNIFDSSWQIENMLGMFFLCRSPFNSIF